MKTIVGIFVVMAGLAAFLFLACQPPEGVVTPAECGGPIKVLSDCRDPNLLFCTCIGMDGVVEYIVDGDLDGVVYCSPNCEPYGRE